MTRARVRGGVVLLAWVENYSIEVDQTYLDCLALSNDRFNSELCDLCRYYRMSGFSVVSDNLAHVILSLIVRRHAVVFVDRSFARVVAREC